MVTWYKFAFDVNVMRRPQRLLTFCPKWDAYSSKCTLAEDNFCKHPREVTRNDRSIKTGSTPFQEYSPNHFITQTTEMSGASGSGRGFA